MNGNLKPGLIGETSFIIASQHLASMVGSGEAHVFSTPMLIAGMEAAAVKCVASWLEPGQSTVGYHIDVEHLAPTLAGEEAHFRAVLEKVAGNRLDFQVQAWDSAGITGSGKHSRVIVNLKEFEAKAAKRLAQSKPANEPTE